MAFLAQAVGMRNGPERPSNSVVVESCSLLNGLEAAERQRLADRSFMTFAEKGEVIWISGTAAQFCAIVATGFVKMTRTTPNGTEMVMELLGPGQSFGLLAAIEGRDFPLSAYAATETWYLKIPSREIQSAYTASAPLKDQVVRNIGPRLRRAHDMMSRLSSGRVEERIAAVLFILSDSYGRMTRDGIQIQVPLTRQDLGEMAGTTTETTIRILSKWQKEGMVSTDRHLITIHDQEALHSVMHGI